MKLRSGHVVGISPPEKILAWKTKFVWRGTIIEPEKKNNVEEWFLSTFNARVRYEETLVTSKGRHDAVFSIHPEDVARFAVARLRMGSDMPSWWEDYVANL